MRSRISAHDFVDGPSLPKVGDRVGEFEILERVGQGGMAVVFKARHPRFPDPVALKIATQQVFQNIDLSKRFESEYSLGRQLSHPNIVNVHAFGIEDGVPYLVMEYVPGCDLDKYIQQNGTLREEEAISIFSQVAAALQFIHERNLVHRDIKPANILIDPSGHVKLTDFGLIKDTVATDPVTGSGVTLGTPDYSAPEQYENAANVDYRCDIFALGVTLYVALTGIFPFGRASLLTTLFRKVKFEFAPLSHVLLQVGVAIDQAVNRAMHPDPKMRQASVANFLAEIMGKATESRPHLTPNLAESCRPGSKNRRRHERTLLTIPGVKVSRQNSDTSPIVGETTNISAHGLCIMASRAFSIGSILKLAFPTTASNQVLHVRVCWVRQTLNQKWLMGCAFVSQLVNVQLEMLAETQLPKTEVLRNSVANSRRNGNNHAILTRR
jgi:serine/threonine protein kinase